MRLFFRKLVRSLVQYAAPTWLSANMRRPVDLDEMARRVREPSAAAFASRAAPTPLQWLQTAHVRRAQSLLETTDLSIEQVATAAGFATATTFRDRLFRTVGLSPTAYRKAFGTKTQCCEA